MLSISVLVSTPFLGAHSDFALALGLSFAAAVLFVPALSLGKVPRVGMLALLGAPILLSPLLIRADNRFLRFLASVTAAALLAKLYDLHASTTPKTKPGLAPVLSFLVNPCSLVLRKLADERRPSRWTNVTRLTLSVAGLVAGAWLFRGLYRIDWTRLPFALEHAAKVVALYLAILPATAAIVASWRLLGGVGRDLMDHPFLALTPADFWRRYNRPTQQFFYEDVFKPAGGLRAPVRGVLFTFALSAVIHEYVFGIALGRVQGYQTAFFLLQGIAVALTARLRPRGWRAAICAVATWAFLLTSSILFFASMDSLVPLYCRRRDAWAGG